MKLQDKTYWVSLKLACDHTPAELRALTLRTHAGGDTEQTRIHLNALWFHAYWYGNWGVLIEVGMLTTLKEK